MRTDSLLCGILLAAACFVGCASPVPPRFPDHTAQFASAPANAGFSLYVQAAEAAQEDAGDLADRTHWTPGQKDAAIKKASRAISLIQRAQREQTEYVFTPTSPTTSRTGIRGWKFIERVFIAKIDEALKREDSRQAAELSLTAIRFGCDLAGGDAIDAGFGLSVIRSSCEQIWKAYPVLSQGDLRRLYEGLSAIARRLPNPESVIGHERENMLMAVQWLQELYVSGDLKAVSEALGDSVGPAVSYLRKLKSERGEEQTEYFEKMAAEAQGDAAWLMKQAALSPKFRRQPDELTGERPWRRFADHLFRNGRMYLSAHAETEARLKLMAVDAALMSRFKSRGEIPKSLEGLPEWLRTDPFSGRNFGYLPMGADYRVYSVGPDGKDDGGASTSFNIGTDITAPR